MTECRLSRSIPQQMFFKIGVLNNFPNLTGKNVCWSLFLMSSCRTLGLQIYQKDNPTEVFSCKTYEIFKKTFFIEHFRWLFFSFLDKLSQAVHVLFNDSKNKILQSVLRKGIFRVFVDDKVNKNSSMGQVPLFYSFPLQNILVNSVKEKKRQ